MRVFACLSDGQPVPELRAVLAASRDFDPDGTPGVAWVRSVAGVVGSWHVVWVWTHSRLWIVDSCDSLVLEIFP